VPDGKSFSFSFLLARKNACCILLMFFCKIQVIAAALSGLGYISRGDLFLRISEVAEPRKKTGTPKIIKQIVSMLEKVREEPREGAVVVGHVKASVTEELEAIGEEPYFELAEDIFKKTNRDRKISASVHDIKLPTTLSAGRSVARKNKVISAISKLLAAPKKVASAILRLVRGA
jgi:hypothetical protein